MKDKSVFIFSSIIVIALAVLAVAAFVYSLSELPGDENSEVMITKDKSMTGSKNTEPGRYMAEEARAFPGVEVSPQDTMKILISLFSVGSIIFTQIRNKNVFRIFAGMLYALSIAFLLGKWGIHMACVERGYEAVGGEYCLVYVVGWAAGTAIDHFFDSLEEFKYERACRKERG